MITCVHHLFPHSPYNLRADPCKCVYYNVNDCWMLNVKDIFKKMDLPHVSTVLCHSTNTILMYYTFSQYCTNPQYQYCPYIFFMECNCVWRPLFRLSNPIEKVCAAEFLQSFISSTLHIVNGLALVGEKNLDHAADEVNPEEEAWQEMELQRFGWEFDSISMVKFIPRQDYKYKFLKSYY